MKATIVDRSLPNRLAIRDVEPPVAGNGDALVKVVATSLNLGEARRSLLVAEDGHRPGWDVAGIVEQAARDGTGPSAGSRVVGFIETCAWSETVAIPARRLAVIPDAVSFEQAATLPVAGLTAYYALAQGGLLAGKSVLVNGASGGVGHIACQIAKTAGARVVAVVRGREGAELLSAYEPDEVLVTERLGDAASAGPYDVILESVGGDALGQALGMLDAEGVCVTFGDAGDKPAAFHPRPFFRANGTRLYGLFVHEEVQRAPPALPLTRMMRLIERGSLVPEITHRAPWEDIAETARLLVDRKIRGKAVIAIGE